MYILLHFIHVFILHRNHYKITATTTEFPKEEKKKKIFISRLPVKNQPYTIYQTPFTIYDLSSITTRFCINRSYVHPAPIALSTIHSSTNLHLLYRPSNHPLIHQPYLPSNHPLTYHPLSSTNPLLSTNPLSTQAQIHSSTADAHRSHPEP